MSRRSAPLPRARWLSFVAAGLLHGVFLALAFPPVGLWPVALVAIVPLIWAACRTGGSAKSAAMLVGLGAFPGWMFQHVWLLHITGPGYPAMGVYMSAYTAVFVWLIAQARCADWPIPMSVVAGLLWTAFEVLRGELLLTGYGFYLLGHPMIDSTLLSAPAAILGAYAISTLCAGIAGAVADAAGWSGLSRPTGGAGALVIAAVWLALGAVGLSVNRDQGPQSDLRVGVVQTNLPQSNKIGWSIANKREDMKRFIALTEQVGTQRPAPDVILWPETMFPGDALNREAIDQFDAAGVFYRVRDDAGQETKVPASAFAADLLATHRTLGTPMLVGGIAMDGNVLELLNPASTTRPRRYNSVHLLMSGRIAQDRYDKVDLTPFGEVIPYVHRWPRVQQMVLNLGAAGMQFDLSAGTRAMPIRVPVGRSDYAAAGVMMATPICFEVTRPGLCRRLALGDGTPGGRAGVLVNFSNDGWFGDWDPGRQVHMLAARWRCVELGLPMVRAVNTGISAAIDRRGQLIGTDGGLRREAALVLTIPVQTGAKRAQTPFVTLGSVPMLVLAGLGGALGVACWWRRRRVETGLL